MTSHSASSEDALQIYTLAVAYLNDAKFDGSSVADTLRVKEMSPGVFYLWQRDRRQTQGGQVGPVAICTYHAVSNTWKVDFASGETLTLVDEGSVWGTEKKIRPALNTAKKKPRYRNRKRKNE